MSENSNGISEKTKVSVIKVDGPEQREHVQAAVEQAVHLIGGWSRFLKPGGSVMLKPNYTGNLPEDSGGVTSNAVMESIIRLLREYGAGTIAIVEGCGTIALGTKRIFANLGIDKIAARYGVEVIDANLLPSCTQKSASFRELDHVTFARQVFDYDLIINVPVMKTHPLVEVTVSMKNMNGLLEAKEKRRFHDVNLRQAIVDFHTVLPSYLTIVDGLIGMEGMGPAEGMPVPLGIIMAGDNPAAVDATAARIMGFDPESIPYLQYASASSIGPIRESDIDVMGTDIESVRQPFAPAKPDVQDYPGVTVTDLPSPTRCIGCRAVMSIALNRLKAAKDLPPMSGMHILLNDSPETTVEMDPTDHLFCIGACTLPYYEARHHENPDRIHFIKGCAPAGLTVEDAFRQVYQVPRKNLEFTSTRSAPK